MVPTGSSGPPGVARADLAFRVEHLPLFGPEGGRFAEHVPLARRLGLRRRGGARILRKVEREAADERALAIVQLDGRGQPRAGERGLPPDEERAFRCRAGGRAAALCRPPARAVGHEQGQHRKRVDFPARLGQPFLQRL